MENASKALLIAGGFLIAIILLSLFAYLFTSMSESSGRIADMILASEKSEYNQKFLNYDGRGAENPLSIQEVITLTNLAKDCNRNMKFPCKVTVKVDTEEWQDKNEDFLNSKLQDSIENKYSCSVGIDTSVEVVNIVTLTKLN